MTDTGLLSVRVEDNSLWLTNNLPFVNGGEPVSWAPDIPIWLSLVVIIGILTVTTVASLIRTRVVTRRPS